MLLLRVNFNKVHRYVPNRQGNFRGCVLWWDATLICHLSAVEVPRCHSQHQEPGLDDDDNLELFHSSWWLVAGGTSATRVSMG